MPNATAFEYRYGRSAPAARRPLARPLLDVGGIAHVMFAAVVAAVRGARARQVQWQRARATHDALRRLDDRTLRDLGFDRSETGSVAAEVAGIAERTRVRTIATTDPQPQASVR